MKIIVTSSCFIAEKGVVGRTYVAGEIVDASAGLAKEFVVNGRGREATAAELAAFEGEPATAPEETPPVKKARAAKPKAETAAIQTPGAPSLIS